MPKEKCEYCDSDMFISKRGNLYCSNICWTKDPYREQRLHDQLKHEAVMEVRHGDWGDR